MRASGMQSNMEIPVRKFSDKHAWIQKSKGSSFADFLLKHNPKESQAMKNIASTGSSRNKPLKKTTFIHSFENEGRLFKG